MTTSFRKFILLLVALLGVVSACSGNTNNKTGAPPTPTVTPDPARAEKPPNIILIVTDDQPYYTLEDMPVVWKELVGRGVNFTNGFVTTPACCPSRASILTGQYARNHGVLTNKGKMGGVFMFDDNSTLATWLHDSGYKTGFMGKYLNVYPALGRKGYIPPGWDEWQAFSGTDKKNGKGNYRGYKLNNNGEVIQYGYAEEDYSTVVLQNKAVNFIKQSVNDPYFLMLSYFGPHGPQNFLEKHKKTFTPDDLTFLPNFNEEDISDKPNWVQGLDEVAEDKAIKLGVNSLRSLAAVDEAVAEILHALEITGQSKNTVIIFLSDNGLAWGEHRWLGQKGCAYEECAKVPFVVYYPGITTAPRVDKRFALNIDLAPTIAEIAGAEVPDWVDGQSLMPLLKDSQSPWREGFILEHFQKAYRIPPYKALRTQEWKYVEYESGEFELYDMIHDPWELVNLAYQEEYQDILLTLSNSMKELIKK